MTADVQRDVASRRPSWLPSAAVLALYVSLVVWLTWPLTRSIDTHLPNTYAACLSDPLQIAWVLAYQSHRLTTAPAAFAQANIYHPTRRALFYGEAAYGALPYFMPVFLLTGNPTLALNLTFLGAVILTAWGLHVLVVRWTGSHLGGVLAGWLFLTTPWVFWVWFPVAPNYALVHYFPLVMLWAAVPSGRFGRTLRLLAPVVLEGLTTIYMAAAVLIPLAVLGCGRLVRRSTRRAGLHLLMVVAVATGLLLGAYAGHFLMLRDNPGLATQTFWPSILSSSAARATTLPWAAFSPMDPTGIPTVAFLVIGLGVLSVLVRTHGALDRDERTAWQHATFWAVIGIAISVTPTVRWYGTTLRLPTAFLPDWLPVYEALRSPYRLGVVGLLGLAVLTGVAFAECTKRLPLSDARWRTATSAALAAFVMIVSYTQYATGAGMPWTPYGAMYRLPRAYPLQRMAPPAPALLRVLTASRGPLLEVPAPAGTGTNAAAPQARALYNSIFHWRPVLNGYDSYWPIEFPARMQLAAHVRDPGALAELRAQTGLELILVHAADLTEDGRNAWLDIARQGEQDDLRLVARDGTDLLFSVWAEAGQRDGGR